MTNLKLMNIMNRLQNLRVGRNLKIQSVVVSKFFISQILNFRKSPILKSNINTLFEYSWGFPGGSVVKNPPSNEGDVGSIPELGRSPGGGHGNPLQYSCLENPMDMGAQWATVQGVTKSQTWLSNRACAQTHTHMQWVYAESDTVQKTQSN